MSRRVPVCSRSELNERGLEHSSGVKRRQKHRNFASQVEMAEEKAEAPRVAPVLVK